MSSRIAVLFFAIGVVITVLGVSPQGLATPQSSTLLIEVAPPGDLPTVLSNAPNHSTIRLAPGTYPVVPALIFSGGLGGINFFNKTNVTIEGAGESTIIDGSSAIGEVLHMTNCSGITLRGVTLRGRVETNYTLVSGVGHVWGTFSIFASEHITVEQCRFIDGHDHGIHDVGAQPYWDVISTNNIVIRNNYFENFGSARTNEVVRVDGTAVVPTGWLVEGNEFRHCLRCVEPYSESDDNPNLFYNCVIRSNVMVNTLDAAILTAGSTNGQNLLIEGNFIYNEPGYTRRGTNIHVDFTAINLNAGHGHVIRGNTISEVSYIGISIGGGPLSTGDITIEGNQIEYVDAQDQGFGIFTFAANGLQISNVVIRGNIIARTKNYGMYLRSLRNSIVEDNVIENACLVPGAAIKVATDEQGRNEGVMIRRNEISDFFANMLYGIEVTSNNRSVWLEDNCIEGAITKPVLNDAGGEMIFASRGSACSATAIPVIINEWMADNSGIVIDPADGDSDDWFELKNLGDYSVNLSGYFLSDSEDEKLKFQIPTDRAYVLPPQGYAIVRADNEERQNRDGSDEIHSSFKLAKTGGIIGLYAGDGTVISEISYGPQTNNVSEGYSPTNAVSRIFMTVPTPGRSNVPHAAPLILRLSLQDGNLVMTFSSEVGAKYQVEGTSKWDGEDSEEWEEMGEEIQADSTTTSVSLPTGTNQVRYFRVSLHP